MFLPAVLWGLLGQGLQVRPADGPGPSSGAGDRDSASSRDHPASFVLPPGRPGSVWASLGLRISAP